MEKKALRISYGTSQQKQGPPQKQNTSFSLRSPESPPKNAEKNKQQQIRWMEQNHQS